MMRRVPEVGTLSKGMRHKGRLPVRVSVCILAAAHIRSHQRVKMADYIAEILDAAVTYQYRPNVIESVLYSRMAGVIQRIGHFITRCVNWCGPVLTHGVYANLGIRHDTCHQY